MDIRKPSAHSIARVIWYYLCMMKPYRGLAILTFGATIVTTLLDLWAPLYYKDFFNLITSGNKGSAVGNQLLLILLIIVAIHFARWIADQLRWKGLIKIEPYVMADINQSAFAHLIGHSYRFFGNSFIGALVSKVHKLARTFEQIFDTTVSNFLPLLIAVVGILVVLFFRNATIAWALLIWTIIFVGANYGFTRLRLKHDIARSAKDSQCTGALADALTNSINIKLFSAFDFEKKRYAKVTDELRDMQYAGWSFNKYIDGAQALLMVGIEFVIMYAAVRFWQQGQLTIGDFALLQGYLLNLFGKLNSSRKLIRRLFEWGADAAESLDVIELVHEVKDKRGAKRLTVKKGEVQFKQVGFQYGDGQHLINDLALEIKPGERIALVGPSGAGKSTVVKLLLRFFDLQKGEILIDGQSIREVTQDSLRDAIALVPQEPILFHRSLMENIRYGNREASDKQVIEASKRAQCHEFITELSEGYDTLVGERGIKLSGGERQRVAIARAILKNAPILLLDEATSSLDSESEQAIQKALAELMKGKTTIAIAHRLSTIMQMDRIVVMENGHVTDSGTHNDLLDRRGIYQTLWKIQAGGFLA